jgi:hypothetical protein
VQPVGVAVARSENAPAATPAETSRPASATTAPARNVLVREARAAQGAPRKRVRPATYPIREFLAWRR